jgi:WD40 repeat protein
VVKLIHGESESELQSTPEYEAAPTIISFSEHRRHIGVGFKNFTLKVWNVDSNFTLKYVFTKHTGDITGLAFVKDNRYMISGSKDNTIIMWDMKVERSPYSVSLIEREVIWFKCSSDHKRLFFNQNSNCFMIWEVPQLTKNARYRKHTDKVNCVEFLYNSFELISVGDDGLAVIWDYRNDSMQEFVQLEGQLTHVIASKFGHFVLITSTKPCIYRWNLSTLNVEDYEVNSPIWCIKFSSDENMVAVGNDMNWIIIYDTEVMEKKTTIKGHVQPVTSICFIEDNNVVLSRPNNSKMGCHFRKQARDLLRPRRLNRFDDRNKQRLDNLKLKRQLHYNMGHNRNHPLPAPSPRRGQDAQSILIRGLSIPHQPATRQVLLLENGQPDCNVPVRHTRPCKLARCEPR